VQLTLGLLIVLIVIFFLVSLVSVLLGSTFSFVRTVNSCQLSTQCKLNAPNILELWNDDLKYRVTKLYCILEQFYSIFNYPRHVLNYISVSIKHFFKVWTNSHKQTDVEPINCVPKTHVSLYFEWPDTFLPSYLDSLVWTPSQLSILSGEFSLTWNVENNEYTHNDETRYGITRSDTKENIHSFIHWKLDMKFMPLHCQIITVEMRYGDSGGRLLKYWDSPFLYQSREIVLMATVTNWEQHSSCHNQKFNNITWIVHFNAEACRMDASDGEL